jgi:predicted anti-sigma-YlaC factor YlaD
VNDRRLVAGLWCEEVLDRLSDYLDGDLTAGERARVEDHLRGCAGCTRFGGEMTDLLAALRRHLRGEEGGLPPSARERLRAALRHRG